MKFQHMKQQRVTEKNEQRKLISDEEIITFGGKVRAHEFIFCSKTQRIDETFNFVI